MTECLIVPECWQPLLTRGCPGIGCLQENTRAEGGAVVIPPPPRCRLTSDHDGAIFQRAELLQLGDPVWVPHRKEPKDPLSLGPRTDVGETKSRPAFLQGEQPPLRE